MEGRLEITHMLEKPCLPTMKEVGGRHAEALIPRRKKRDEKKEKEKKTDTRSG